MASAKPGLPSDDAESRAMRATASGRVLRRQAIDEPFDERHILAAIPGQVQRRGTLPPPCLQQVRIRQKHRLSLADICGGMVFRRVAAGVDRLGV